MTTIQPGDRVSFVQRPARWFGAVLLPERIVRGVVCLVEAPLAWIATEPDGLWQMAELAELEKLELEP
jgi:hypothetical protein